MATENHIGDRLHKMKQERERVLSRRKFFKATCFATAGVVAGACSKYKNPLDSTDREPLLNQPITPTSGGRIGGAGDPLATVAVADVGSYEYAVLRDNIQASLEVIGGLSDIIKPGDTVGIKLNMTGGESSARKTPNSYGLRAEELYWTHPEILKVVGELIKDAGAGRILVMEANYDEASVIDWGYQVVCDYLGAEYIDLNSPAPYGDFLEKEVPNPLTHWNFYYHNGAFYDLDCFVTLPKIKRHYGAGMTNALKNMIGSVPLAKYQLRGAYRAKLHRDDDGEGEGSYEGWKNLVRTIVDLNRIRPAHLAVCDAIKTADNGEGPWNQGFTPLTLNTLITSKDPVAADAIGTTLFGFDPKSADQTGPFASDSLPGDYAGADNYLRIADEQGLGCHDPDKIQVINATEYTYVEKHGG